MNMTVPAIEDRPTLATPALWARIVLVVDSDVPGEVVKRQAAHWYGVWAPYWPLPWNEPLSLEGFTAALRQALQQARPEIDAFSGAQA